MIKKIFFVAILILTIALVINTVSASSRQTTFTIPTANSEEINSNQDKLTVIKVVKDDEQAASSTTKGIITKTSDSKKSETLAKVVSEPKLIAKKISYPYGTTMRWNSTSLNFLGHMASFDYNYSIRASVIRKIEAYARSRNISTITMGMMDAMTK
jgi:hypothetical protein